jgi:predicted dehydrogenase
MAGGAMLPTIVPARALGREGAVAPSERIVLGALGIGGRGRHVLSRMLEQPDVQFVAMCDVQTTRRESVEKLASNRYGVTSLAMYRDMHEMLARPDVDAVLIATGDRWHALASILAAKAGKDVYSEKPCGITIEDCRELADTINRYGRVFQAGTQRRSIANFKFAADLAHSGKLGQVHTLRASAYTPRLNYGWRPAEPEPPKDECDWDRWLGPAPWRPYNSRYVSGGWRGFYDFDSGCSLLDWAAHTVDLCQWANQSDDTTPIEFVPYPTNITARYANGVRLIIDFLATPFGDRSPHYHTENGTCPVRYVGDEGWIETGDTARISVSDESLLKGWKPLKMAGTDPATHVRNFFDCVKSRQLTNANQNVMRHSHIASHAAAIAWQLGRKLTFDPVTESFVGDEEANRLRSRARRAPWHA